MSNNSNINLNTYRLNTRISNEKPSEERGNDGTNNEWSNLFKRDISVSLEKEIKESEHGNQNDLKDNILGITWPNQEIKNKIQTIIKMFSAANDWHGRSDLRSLIARNFGIDRDQIKRFDMAKLTKLINNYLSKPEICNESEEPIRISTIQMKKYVRHYEEPNLENRELEKPEQKQLKKIPSKTTRNLLEDTGTNQKKYNSHTVIKEEVNKETNKTIQAVNVNNEFNVLLPTIFNMLEQFIIKEKAEEKTEFIPFISGQFGINFEGAIENQLNRDQLTKAINYYLEKQNIIVKLNRAQIDSYIDNILQKRGKSSTLVPIKSNESKKKSPEIISNQTSGFFTTNLSAFTMFNNDSSEIKSDINKSKP